MAKIKTFEGFDPSNPDRLAIHWTTIGETDEYNLQDFSQEIRDRALWMGIKDRLGDKHADADTAEEARRMTTELAQHMLATGDWFMRAGGGGRESWVVHAISEIREIAIEDVRAKWAQMDAKTKRAVAQDPEVLRWRAANLEDAGPTSALDAF